MDLKGPQAKEQCVAWVIFSHLKKYIPTGWSSTEARCPIRTFVTYVSLVYLPLTCTSLTHFTEHVKHFTFILHMTHIRRWIGLVYSV